MNSLLDQIVAEVRLHNPNASVEEISESIASIISKEILPSVFRNISLPAFPSYRSVEISRSGRANRSSKLRHQPIENLGDRRNIIQQIERVRNEMGWDGADDVSPKMFIADSSSLQTILRADSSLPTRETIKEKDFEEKLQEDEKETVSSTFQKMPKKPEKDVISLSETAQRKIVSEPLFETFFKNVEMQLRNTIASRKLKTEIDVVCKSDREIPSWNKCVLKVHPPSDLDFKDRMNLSTVFDITIRNTIKDLKKTADPKTTEYLQNLNDNLFVHIDM